MTVDGTRGEIERRALPRRALGLIDESGMDEAEREWRQAKAVFLIACEYPRHYVAKCCGVSPGTLSAWMKREEMRQALNEIRADQLAGGLKLLRSYALQLIDSLAEMALTEPNPTLRLKAICEALDRLGLPRVTKSIAVTEQLTEKEREDEVMRQMFSMPVDQLVSAAGKVADAKAAVQEHIA